LLLNNNRATTEQVCTKDFNLTIHSCKRPMMCDLAHAENFTVSVQNDTKSHLEQSATFNSFVLMLSHMKHACVQSDLTTRPIADWQNDHKTFGQLAKPGLFMLIVCEDFAR